ncbi:hypothetical protein C3F09_00260 [candidate division GN15 bacterium]|uniref:histidine kinase n=1 Tax=candidate division GN15 bacterium TaxID=2072418 RepID=A0A855XDB5_9BACT|nr:MAG: hypothetical protein C3F09_00260 [candidate division GN15 bacterium]
MSASFDLLQRYYNARESTRFTKVLDQIDAVARLLLKLVECDFVAVFYAGDQEAGLVPVAYHNWEGREVKGLAELEATWRRFGQSDIRIPRGFRHFQAEAGRSNEAPDQFAELNGFRSRFAYPIVIGGTVHGAVVAYWSKPPDKDYSEINYVLNPLAEVILSCMSLTEEMQSIGAFSLRLSTLISMFELPVDGKRIPDLLSEMLKIAGSVAPRCAVELVSRDTVTGTYNVTQTLCSAGQEIDLERMATEAGIAFENAATVSQRNWHDLGPQCGREPLSVIAADILSRKPYMYGIVFWTETGTPFGNDALQLITFFRLFSQTILSTAYLVRELTKDRARALESSSRLADAETMAALADMSSGVAHDFNNIIGAIVGRLQILKLKCQDEAMVAALNRLEATALEGSETVHKLQQFTTSVRTKQLKSVDMTVLIRDYFSDSRAVWRPLSEEKHVTVEFHPSAVEATVRGIPEDLVTVLEHLILNAVEFAPEGSRVPVELSESGQTIGLTVTDSGAGIPEGIRPRVFYPFFTTKSAKGAGMGLAIVYGIVSRHGGKVTFDTEVGRGTVFTISLPRAENLKEQSDISRKIVTSNRLRILVVDDDEQIREVLSDMLSLDGHTPTRCKDGYEALKVLDSEKYDMMVTDLGMPGMSGLDLAGIVHEKDPQMPIAMITGWGMQLDHNEMAIKGIKSVLSKPFHLKDVKALVLELTGAAPTHH